MKIVLCTGGFDPIHSGHIAYLKAAKTLGDMLIVGINSDEWLARKKGRAFMPWNERLCILNNISVVDEVYTFDDDDGSANHFIQQVRAHYPDAEIIFANGGDRDATNIPELLVPDVMYKFGVGGENKANSSSKLLENWRTDRVDRSWGYYSVLHQTPGTKTKFLSINPGASLSMQRHKNRAEQWHVVSGTAILNSMMPKGYSLPSLKLATHSNYTVPVNEWHQLTNPFDEPCEIIEIQYGTECTEEDIERK